MPKQIEALFLALRSTFTIFVKNLLPIRNMDKVTYNGLTFEPYLTRDDIAREVKRIAGEIKQSYADDNPLFLCVLNGAAIFAVDLFRECGIPQSEITFIRFKSYEGTSTTGTAKQVLGLNESIEGRTVIVVEDIVDTGVTAKELLKVLREKNPREVKLASLLFKPDSLQTGVKPDYIGFSIPPKFIIGYGLDIDGKARNLRDIFVLSEQQ